MPLKIKNFWLNFCPVIWKVVKSTNKGTFLQYNTELLLGFQIRGCYQYCGGHIMSPPVGIGLREIPNSKGAKAPTAPPLTPTANDSSG